MKEIIGYRWGEKGNNQSLERTGITDVMISSIWGLSDKCGLSGISSMTSRSKMNFPSLYFSPASYALSYLSVLVSRHSFVIN